MDEPEEITYLLEKWRTGDDDAMDRLMPILYPLLRRRARNMVRNQTLSCTELVHEAWLELASNRDRELSSRSHFLNLAGRIMRHILINHINARNAIKRGGNQVFVTLDFEAPGQWSSSILPVLQAVERLEERDPRKAKIFDMKYLLGSSIPEICEHLDLSESTVKRDLRFISAWIGRAVKGQKQQQNES